MHDIQEKYDFHFIALGGVGQSALAKILLQLGYKVSGSDINESKYLKLTRELGAKTFIGHNKDNILGRPKVVISSAIKENNPELIRAKELNLEIMHRSDCLKFISEKFPCFIGFSGTHGKTTTSGLLSFVSEKMNQKPSYARGGIIPKLNIKYFFAELDESDGTIQKYSPDYLVINNLEADHLDFYKNGLEDIIPVFEHVIDNISQKDKSKIFVNIDNFGCNKFLNQTKFKNIVINLGFNDLHYAKKNTPKKVYQMMLNVINKINIMFDKPNIYILNVCHSPAYASLYNKEVNFNKLLKSVRLNF